MRSALLGVWLSGCALLGYEPERGDGRPDAAVIPWFPAADAEAGDNGAPTLDAGGGAPGFGMDAGGGDHDSGEIDAGSMSDAGRGGDAGRDVGPAPQPDAGWDGGVQHDAGLPGCPDEVNACGGCAPLPQPVGGECGACGLGRYVCDGTDQVVCSGGSATPRIPPGGLLVDDFEDGDAVANRAEGLNGAWYTSADSSGGTVTPAPGTPFSPIGVGRESALSARIYGAGFSDWGASLALTLNGYGCTVDASQVSGLRLYVRGSGTMVFSAASIGTVPVAEGGSCLAGCYDHHQQQLTLTGAWTLHWIPWTALAQSGWGTPAPFDPRRLVYIELLMLPGEAFDLYADDIRFY